MKATSGSWRIYVAPVMVLVSLALASCKLPDSARIQGTEGEMVQEIPLPEPKTRGDVSLEETIAKRRSIRSFSERELTTEQISQLLWAAQGITDKARGFRTAPSAGALYPLNVYVVKKDGVFLYSPQRHSLLKKLDGDKRRDLAASALRQMFIAEAPVVIVISAVFERTTAKYGRRGVQYVYLEAGHAAQNIHLEAVALGLGSVPVGAFVDEDVAEVLGLGEDDRPIYIIPVGYKR